LIEQWLQNFLIFNIIVLRNTDGVNHASGFLMHASTLSATPAFGARHRWKVLGVGVAANVSFSAAANGLPTTAVWLRSSYHLGSTQLGVALGAMGLGIACSELPWGMATDRYGDRPVLLTGLVGSMLALLAMMLWLTPGSSMPSLPMLAAGLTLTGLLIGSVNGASGRAIMRWFGAGERGFAMSIRQTAVPLGGALGALLLPPLASHFGFGAVFGALAVCCALSAFFTWHWMHEPALSANAASGPQNVPKGQSDAATTPPSASPFSNRQLWRIVAAIGLLCVPQFAVLTYATVFLHDHGHLGLASITGVMVALQAGAMVMRIWSGRHTDRHGNRPAYLRAATLVVLALFLLLSGATASNAPDWLLMGTLVLAGIGVSAWHGVAYTELAVCAGSHSAGTALGMANTAVFIGFFCTPVMIAQLLNVGAWWWVWAAAGLVALATRPLFPPPPCAPVKLS